MSISKEAFARAQSEELKNWQNEVSQSSRVISELTEHSEVSGPLRDVLGQIKVARALEVGIGPYGMGFLAVHLPDLIQHIDGLDPLPRLELHILDRPLADYINAVRGRVNYVQHRAETMPFDSESYDLVSCINVIDHTQDPGAILNQITRVLKRGSTLVFGVNTLSSLGEIKWRIIRARNPNDFMFVAHPHTYQWHVANRFVQSTGMRALWSNRPSLGARCAGHSRMSFWILRKD